MALTEQRDKAFKDLPILQTELKKALKEASFLKQEHADLVKKVQEKINLIDQLWAEMDEVKATIEVWKGKIDMLASEKVVAKAELASVENQLQVAKDKADKWSRLNDDLQAQLSSAVTELDALGQEYVALRSKLDATSTDAEEIVAQYKTNVEVAETRLKTKTEYIKRLSQRETLEEIHARGFDLSAEIEEARRLKAKAKERYEPKGSEGSDDSGDESGPGEDHG
ncbi:uncharacterized protein [Nicotiana tomentosiformis]|uniref:uncharacterized protein n=1 Tax=Nicotiana tomentosiformis TaxID=4098 RepID=UPI00388C76A3